MFAIQRQLKLNKEEQQKMAQHAGFAFLVYNYGLNLFWSSVNAGVKASDSKRIQAIKKCLINITKKRPEFAPMNELSSKVYQSALENLKTAFSLRGAKEPPKHLPISVAKINARLPFMTAMG